MAADRALRAVTWCLALAVGLSTGDRFAWCETDAATGCVGKAKEFTLLHEYSFNVTRRSGIKAGNVQRLSFREVQPVLADWDGDGDLDLAFLSPDTTSMRFFEHRSTNIVELSESPFVGRTAGCHIDLSAFSMADWDGDGLSDLIAANGQSGGVAICKQMRDGQFQMIDDHPFAEVSSFQAISMLDWDHDGDFDLLVMKDHQLLLLEQDDGKAIKQGFHPDPIWHFTAVSRDGAVDLLVSGFPDGHAKYFRHHKNNLEEMLGDYNPFNRMMAADAEPTFALNDWNADGELDFLVITAGMMKLYHQQPREFVEAKFSEHPLDGIASTDALAFKDINADGILDVILVDGEGSLHCFERDGAQLVELSNPFKHAQLGQVPEKMLLLADVDADGDLDIVRSHVNDGGISYYQQENGHFHFLEGSQNPFHQVGLVIPGERVQTCPSLLDWDGDGYVELVLGSTTGHFDYFRQVNKSFKRVLHTENPFWNVHARMYSGVSNQVPSAPACAAFADLDGDGDLDVLVSSSFGLVYYEQEINGSFRLMESPFAAIEKEAFQPGHSVHSVSLVDWNGTGSHDLVLAGNAGISYWAHQRCPPSSCQGSCNPRNGKCICPAGVEGPHCTTCSKSLVGSLSAACQKCPGHGTTRGTCQRRGMCQESGTISPVCRCMSPFSGLQCDEGSCPQGQFLHSDADLFLRSEWYPQWEACMPCAPGRFKANSGNEACRDCDPGRYQTELGQTECNLCPEGHVASFGQATCDACPLGRLAGLGSASCATCPTGRVVGANQTECVRCGSGTSPLNGTECMACDWGYVAEAGSGFCTPCAAGSVPDVKRSKCIACAPGKFAAERSENCSVCPMGAVPDALGRHCITCHGQLYATPGDAQCRVCRFPSMVMGQERICSPLDPVLFLLGFVVTSILSCMLCGWFQLRYLATQLRGLEAIHNYEELHLLKVSYLKFGLWHSRAQQLIAESKLQLDANSRRLGISLSFVLEELRGLYLQKAQAVDWRWYDGELTHAGFLVKIHEADDVETGACTWDTLELCSAPSNPNFYQLASLLTYGPSAVGKQKTCPRDGRPGCSVVDAVRKDGKSAPANWFLSWAWGYRLNDVLAALSRWWDTYSVVAGSPQGSIYLWWCFFVNNQFRMLQDGQTEDTDRLLEIFAKPLESAGKVLMCMDKFQECGYTKRIWCIFEVFSAVRRSIPITLIMPGLDLNQIHQPIVTLEELRSACHVNAEEAGASVKADEEKIKAHILETMTSFDYVNQTVEQALWIEVIKMMKASNSDVEITENVMNDDVTKTNSLNHETFDSPRAARRRYKL